MHPTKLGDIMTLSSLLAFTVSLQIQNGLFVQVECRQPCNGWHGFKPQYSTVSYLAEARASAIRFAAY